MSRGWRRGVAAGSAAVLAVLPPAAAAWWMLEADLGVVPPDDVVVTMTTQPRSAPPVARERYPTSSRVGAAAVETPAASVTVVSLTSAEEPVGPGGDAGQTPGPGGPARPSGDLGIPDLVLEAYQRAADRLTRSHPGCGVSWSLLAGIGKVESSHARGGRVDSTGRTYQPILGPRLDGVSTAAIRDSDGGALDGDTVWDRAVGPMQFIPGTWRAYGTDGNGDGVADPHNVFDAALSAGRYLCAGGGDLTTQAGKTAALLRYNRSMSYVATVLAWAEAYESGKVRPTALLPPAPVAPSSPAPPTPAETAVPTPEPTTGTPTTSPTTSPTATPTEEPTTSPPETQTPTPEPSTGDPTPEPTTDPAPEPSETTTLPPCEDPDAPPDDPPTCTPVPAPDPADTGGG